MRAGRDGRGRRGWHTAALVALIAYALGGCATYVNGYRPETTGTAQPLAGANGASIGGSAIMTRKLTGVTEVAVVMTGLTPDTKYQAHVHNQACAVDNGGSHYKFDRSIAEALNTNEMWFELTADSKGAAHDSMWEFSSSWRSVSTSPRSSSSAWRGSTSSMYPIAVRTSPM